MPKHAVSLDDKYALDETHQILTGTQAIVRLTLTQVRYVMDNSRWEQFARGAGCPLDAPRPDSNQHWDFVTNLSVSSLVPCRKTRPTGATAS